MNKQQLEVKLEELRQAYKNAGGAKREIIKRQAQALKYALGEKV